MSVTVVHLSDLTAQTFTCDPRSAVVAAYAQERQDYDTANYFRRYGHLLFEGRHAVGCGE